MFVDSHPYLRFKPSLNSYFMKKNCIFKDSTHRQLDAPFCGARFLVSFFSDEQLSIFIEFSESVTFCLSILMFLFIRFVLFQLFMCQCFQTEHKWLVTSHNFWKSPCYRGGLILPFLLVVQNGCDLFRLYNFYQ